MFQVWVRTYTAQSGGEHTNHAATTPPTGLQQQQQQLYLPHLNFTGIIVIKKHKASYYLLVAPPHWAPL